MKRLTYHFKLHYAVLTLILTLVTVTGAGNLSSTAWFLKGKDKVPVDTYRGSIRAAYFNGGCGDAPAAGTTAANYKTAGSTYPSYENDGGTGNSYHGPFQIDNATQLYNFAWLQYLGYFNKLGQDQVYFVLTSDIVIPEGLVLPPVGTAANPFIGNFNGNGHTITGLHISDDLTALNNTQPITGYEDNIFNVPQGALQNNALKDPVSSMGFFGWIDEDANDRFTAQVSNVTLSGTVVSATQSGQAIAGIAAGYVNGVMTDVTVSGTSSLSSSSGVQAMLFPNETRTDLSDYALVGYCTETYRDSLCVESVAVYEPRTLIGSLDLATGGMGNTWGDTIEIRRMFTDLKGKYESAASSTTMQLSNDYNPSQISLQTNDASSYGYTLKMLSVKNSADQEVASYFYSMQNSANGKDFVYLDGRQSLTTVTKQESIGCNSIGNDDGHYLQSASPIADTTTASGSKWIVENGCIYYFDNNVKQYLTNNNGTLAISTTADAGWVIDSTEQTIKHGEYYLCYDSVWSLKLPPQQYITDKSEQHFLSIANGSITDKSASANDRTPWEKDDENASDHSFRLKAGTYYLKANSYTLTLTQNASDATRWKEFNPGDTSTQNPKIYTEDPQSANQGYALYCDTADSNTWKLVDYTIGGTGNDWGGSISIKSLNERIDYLATSSSTYGNHRYYQDSNNQFTLWNYAVGGVYRFEGATPVLNKDYTPNSLGSTQTVPISILPITAEDPASHNYAPSSKNTGYIVAGWAGIASGSGNSAKYYYGTNTTIRTSQVSVSRIQNSYTPSNDPFNPGALTVYTNAGNQASSGFMVVNESSTTLQKYKSAKKQLFDGGMLPASTSGKIHGLHFTGAAVNSNNKATMGTAKIKDITGEHTYTNYELPESCIDFNLKEKGYVNFFAGCYTAETSNNDTKYPDSFCGLSIVQRNNAATPAITNTIMIRKIWNNTNTATNQTYPYVYEYKDGNTTKYTTGSVTADQQGFTKGNEQLFDMDYLSNKPATTYFENLFYFEIPVNPGEYAMGTAVDSSGSVKSNGAYLLYLDISANATVEGDSQLQVNGTLSKTTVVGDPSTVTLSSPETAYSPDTYFPLRFNEENPNEVDSTNTGYVISGPTATPPRPPGNIRVSQYLQTPYIAQSLTNGKLADNKVLTISSNAAGTGQQTQSVSAYGISRYAKYITSKEKLQATLDEDRYVYGLHFTNAAISETDLVRVPYALINGTSYYNYEMPRNCIDFRLQSNGFINFFAGTYFSGGTVNSFFSLHKIERYEDGDLIPNGKAVGDIKSIREIKAIYDDTVNGSTVYRYQFIGESAPSGTLVFDTAWLTDPASVGRNQNQNTVFYFEIPAGAGEFALGSVPGKDGAYLIYLDIATARADTLSIFEKQEITQYTYDFPAGVMFDGVPNTAYRIPIPGSYSFAVNNGAVTATSGAVLARTATVTTIERVTFSSSNIPDGMVIERVTVGDTVTYTIDGQPAAAADAAAYFADFPSDLSMILTYRYPITNGNVVTRTSTVVLSGDDDTAIGTYQLNASATSPVLADVTLPVTGRTFGLTFLDVNSTEDLPLQTPVETTVTIPAASP